MKRSLVFCAVALVAMATSSAKADIDVQLNLRYDDPANEAAGGSWDLLVKSDGGGVAGIAVLIDNISGVGANGTTGYNVFESQDSGITTEIVTGFDLVSPALDVGTGAGSTGNVAVDDLFPGNSTWDNSALIASGTFGADRPVFQTTSGTLAAGANEFSGSDAVAATFGTLSVRGDSVATDGLPLGDVNRDGKVGAADSAALFSNWDPLGTTKGWDNGDFNSDGAVGAADSASLFSNWNPLGTGVTPPAIAAVPEPGSLALGVIFAGIAMLRRRS